MRILWFLYEFFFGERKVAKRMFKQFLFVGLGYVPWVIPLYKQITMVKGGFWLGTPNSGDFVHMLFDYLAEGIKTDINIPLKILSHFYKFKEAIYKLKNSMKILENYGTILQVSLSN